MKVGDKIRGRLWGYDKTIMLYGTIIAIESSDRVVFEFNSCSVDGDDQKFEADKKHIVGPKYENRSEYIARSAEDDCWLVDVSPPDFAMFGGARYFNDRSLG